MALVGVASPAWAWGGLGHKIICQIAFEELNDKTRTEIARLIALDAAFNSFADACTWPDHPRKRVDEHFVNVGHWQPAGARAREARQTLPSPPRSRTPS